MTGFDTYCMFVAMKMHFTSPTYDYFKYNGKAKVSVDSFNARRDKYYFEKLARHDDVKHYFVSNFVDRDIGWVGDLVGEQSNKVYSKWQQRNQSLTYNFSEELSSIDDMMSAVKVPKGQHPRLLNLFKHNHINIETLIILNDFLGFIPYWDKAIYDTVIWPSIRNKCVKYRPFISYDRDKIKKIIKDHIHAEKVV